MTLHCRPGEKPAGLVLDPGKLRLADGSRFAVRWQMTGDPGFSAALAGPDTEGTAFVLPTNGTLEHQPPVNEAAGTSPRFVLACPASGGTSTLLDLRLASPSPEPRAMRPSRSAWAWRPERWGDAPEGLVAEARTLGIDRLFVTVEIEDGAIAHEARFSDFVWLAGHSGIAVVVVEGDPGMALDDGRAVALRRLGVLVAYQHRAASDRRLAGVQYDIEPYLLPGFGADPDRILSGWAATIEDLSSAAANLDLDLVLPFWLPGHRSAHLVMPSIGRSAGRMTVMAYRTTADEILSVAEPMLAWSASASLPLHVALEAGPVGDETTRTYGPAQTGDVLLLPQVDGGALVLVLAAPIGPGTEGKRYALDRESVVPGSRVSFLGDRQRLDEAVAQSSARLSAWPSFAGFALHGVID